MIKIGSDGRSQIQIAKCVPVLELIEQAEKILVQTFLSMLIINPNIFFAFQHILI